MHNAIKIYGFYIYSYKVIYAFGVTSASFWA